MWQERTLQALENAGLDTAGGRPAALSRCFWYSCWGWGSVLMGLREKPRRSQEPPCGRLSPAAGCSIFAGLIFPTTDARLKASIGARGIRTVWIHEGSPTTQALEMISILQQADSKGLLPEDYDAASWNGRLARLRATIRRSEEARFDVALTVCTMRYASDVRDRKSQSSTFRVQIRYKAQADWIYPAFVEKRLLKGTDLRSAWRVSNRHSPGTMS